jgi:antiviral helicase SKI2
MGTAKQADLIPSIVHPREENASTFLDELGLASPPSQEQVHQDIEARLLLPPTSFPEQLLSTYQMCDRKALKSYRPADW